MTCASLLLALSTTVVTGCDQEVAGDDPGDEGENAQAAQEGEGGGDAASDLACEEELTFRACALPGDLPDQPTGQQECWRDDDGSLTWTECEDLAQPDDSSGSTPLVFVFDDAPVSFSAAMGHFDLSAVASFRTDWPAAATPWLALDRDGDGAVGSGAELFGSAVTLASGELARNGFDALAELDSDGDGRVTPADARWSSLRLWADGDQDRVSSSDELSPLGSRRIVSIDLAYEVAPRCDGRGNCEVERASFLWVDALGMTHEGAVVDVHLRHR
jgi:hypothetical protein